MLRDHEVNCHRGHGGAESYQCVASLKQRGGTHSAWGATEGDSEDAPNPYSEIT